MAELGKLGRDEGKRRGPEPGDGADVHSSPDVEGTPPDRLPPRAGAETQEPPQKPGRGPG
jgi:hypothetical protein